MKIEGNGVYARKFKYADFPTDQSCQKAAVAYAKKTFTLLTTFDSFRGKATDVDTVVLFSSFLIPSCPKCSSRPDSNIYLYVFDVEQFWFSTCVFVYKTSFCNSA